MHNKKLIMSKHSEAVNDLLFSLLEDADILQKAALILRNDVFKI